MKIFIEILGYIGTISTLIAYFMLSKKIIRSSGLLYPVLNLVGAILLGTVGVYNKSSSIMFINLSWFIISINLLYKNKKGDNNGTYL